MTDIDEIRRCAMKKLEEDAGGPVAAAERAGMSYSQWANLRAGAHDSKTGKRRGMRKETARKIEAAFGKPVGWMDAADTALALIGTQDAGWLLKAWQDANAEAREVARYVLSDLNAPQPAWITSDLRYAVGSLLYAALCWLREEAEPPKKIAAQAGAG